MNILTFDIEDWFHINFEKRFNDENKWKDFESRIERNTDIILEILEEKNIKATFFCLGWVARNYPELVKKIHSLGHDIGSHSNIHNLASNLTQSEFENDLKASLDSIEQVVGEKIVIYRAPGFSIGKTNVWAFEELIQQGIEIDCSVFPARHDYGGFKELSYRAPFMITHPHGFLKEFPMSTHTFLGMNMVVSGGGYFRLFPYSFIKYYLAKSSYCMTYLHPRDLDADQPILHDLGMLRKFKSYYGLKYSLKKFRKLLGDFDFISISEADKSIKWERQHSIELH